MSFLAQAFELSLSFKLVSPQVMAYPGVKGWHCSDVHRLRRAIGDFTQNETEIDQLEIVWARLHVNKRLLQDTIASESARLLMKWKNGQSDGDVTCSETAEKDYQTPDVDDCGQCITAKRLKTSTPPSTSAEG